MFCKYQYFLPFCSLSSYSFDTVFCRAEVFNFNEVQLINILISSVMDCAYGVISKTSLPYSRSSRFVLMLSIKSFIVLHFTFRFMTPFKLIFVKGLVLSILECY